jgi:hypothetical protein
MRWQKTTINEEKAKLIKDTIFKSIMSEVSEKLKNEVHDKSKRDQIQKFTESNLRDILNTFSEHELLPKKPVESVQDFESHILELINLTRDKLLQAVKKEAT